MVFVEGDTDLDGYYLSDPLMSTLLNCARDPGDLQTGPVTVDMLWHTGEPPVKRREFSLEDEAWVEVEVDKTEPPEGVCLQRPKPEPISNDEVPQGDSLRAEEIRRRMAFDSLDSRSIKEAIGVPEPVVPACVPVIAVADVVTMVRELQSELSLMGYSSAYQCHGLIDQLLAKLKQLDEPKEKEPEPTVKEDKTPCPICGDTDIHNVSVSISQSEAYAALPQSSKDSITIDFNVLSIYKLTVLLVKAGTLSLIYQQNADLFFVVWQHEINGVQYHYEAAFPSSVFKKFMEDKPSGEDLKAAAEKLAQRINSSLPEITQPGCNIPASDRTV